MRAGGTLGEFGLAAIGLLPVFTPLVNTGSSFFCLHLSAKVPVLAGKWGSLKGPAQSGPVEAARARSRQIKAVQTG